MCRKASGCLPRRVVSVGGRSKSSRGTRDMRVRRRHRLLPLLAFFVMLALTHVAAAADLTGRVVGITDGDTLTVLDADHRQTKVRLAEIDAPESHQPYGTRSKQALSELVFGRDVRVVVVD